VVLADVTTATADSQDQIEQILTSIQIQR